MFRLVRRRLVPLLAVAVTVLAGCGTSDSTSGDTTTTIALPQTPEGNATYERAFTECASTTLKGLAEKYHVTKSIDRIAVAVGVGWAERFGGGTIAEEQGRLGCLDGIKSRPDAPTSS